MESFNDKKKKLLKYRELIMQMPNNAYKDNIIEGYSGLLGYYKEVCGLTYKEFKEYDIDTEFIDKYDKRYIKCTQNKINEITNLALYIYKKFDILINEYKKNGFCSYEFDLYKGVNKDKLYDLVADFLLFLGKDVAKLYNNIIQKDNIFALDDCDYSGISTNALSIDSPCIIVRNIENTLSYYFTIVHEMGHSYQYYLQRNHTHLESFNPFMETTSLLFEKLFFEFLSSNQELKNELFNYQIENHIYFLNDLASSKVICELLMMKDVKNIDMQSLTYESSVPIEELQRRMVMDCGYIMPNKLNFELTEFHYAIGEIISNYFINKMKNNWENSWKEYKDFICTVDNYPLKEILDKYMDIDLYKENIKEFIKSYRSR